MTSSVQRTDLYDLILERVDGKPMRLARYGGQVLLVVNVASRCRFARQLHALQALHEQYYEAGLRVMGFPCNDFGGMEPDVDAELQLLYERALELNFPVFSKVNIASSPRHPLFEMLEQAAPLMSYVSQDATSQHAHDDRFYGNGNAVRWNFEKFLVGRSGRLLARFGCDVDPLDSRLTAAVGKALQEPRHRSHVDAVQQVSAVLLPSSRPAAVFGV
jgi:glutathione peroxidase